MEVKTQILRLRLDGQTYQYIAKRLGMSRQRVHQLISPPLAIRIFVARKYHARCSKCKIFVGKSGHVHHKNSVGLQENQYNDVHNLVLLCKVCHRTAHGLPKSAIKEKTVGRCRKCGWTWKLRVINPKKCPNQMCQAWMPLREQVKSSKV